MHIRNNEYPYTGWTRDFPLVSFPTPRDGLDFPEQEIYWVHPTGKPEHDPETEYVVEGAPEQVEGQWRQTWEVVPLPVPSIDDLRASAMARINADYEARTAALAEGYPASERESWPVQIAESAIVRGADDEPTPWIDQAAPARGVTRLELANLIHAQDVAYRQYHGALTGIRQALRDEIAAVPDDEHAQSALDAIVWPTEPEPEP